MLEQLRGLFKRYDTLSGILIDETEGMPSTSAYRSRFTSLIKAYTLIGFTPERDYSYIEANRALRQLHSNQCENVIGQLREAGASARRDPITDLYIVNEEFSLSLVVAPSKLTPGGSMRWNLRFETSLRPDVTIAVRLASNNQDIRDYYLFPGSDLFAKQLRLRPQNGFFIDLYRFDDLSFLIGMAERTRIESTA
jgi:hypothetical protein